MSLYNTRLVRFCFKMLQNFPQSNCILEIGVQILRDATGFFFINIYSPRILEFVNCCNLPAIYPSTLKLDVNQKNAFEFGRYLGSTTVEHEPTKFQSNSLHLGACRLPDQQQYALKAVVQY